MRLLLEKKAGERRQQALLEKLSKEHNFELDAPGNSLSPINYHFVELSFEQEPDPVERDYLLSLPTSFRLSQEQVDRIRASAKIVMERNPDLQATLRDLE